MEKTFRIGERSVRIATVMGDITEYDGDAIVNAANNHLWMGSGVAGAIRRKGGPEIEQQAISLGPIEVGDAVVTTGGMLKVHSVIHAAVMGQDLLTSENLIRRATRSALERCREKGLRRVAFPALGTGVGGFPLDQCASIMLEEVASHLKEGGSTLEEVVFYLFGQDAYRAFSDKLKELEIR